MRLTQPIVIVVHGFGGKRIWMRPLSMRLRRCFHVIDWPYFSIAGSIENHAKRFSEFLSNLEHDGPINIVAHSMGSIVTRAALATSEIRNLNRVVLLAPPNSGSPIAKVLNYGFGWACRPLRDLSSSTGSFVNSMPDNLTCDTGVIAARYDMLVPIRSTHMPGLSDHAIITGTHNSLLFSNRVCKMVTRFLTNGRFAR